MNEISKYLLRKRKERRPDDTDHAQAKRIGMSPGILYRMYKSPGAWKQAAYLMMICADIGIDIVSALTQSDSKNDKDKDLNYWKERTFKAESETAKYKKQIQELQTKIGKMLE